MEQQSEQLPGVLCDFGIEGKEAGNMSREKIYRAFLVPLLVLAVVSLTGCQSGEDVPFYLMEGEYNSQVLYMDGIQYERSYPREDEEAYKHYSGSRYCWTTVSEENGQQIGVCGEDADKKPELNIYEVVGDKERIFLYTYPAHFYFGGTDYRLWRQEGVILDAPSAEIVSSISFVYDEEPLFQVDDPEMIAAFMEIYHSATQQAVDIENGGNWRGCSLIMHHKEYPFLQYEIECYYSPEQGTACCRTSALGEWFPLPAEWCKVISEADFNTRDK